MPITLEQAEEWLMAHRAAVYFYPTRANGKVTVHYSPDEDFRSTRPRFADAATLQEAIAKAMEAHNDR